VTRSGRRSPEERSKELRARLEQTLGAAYAIERELPGAGMSHVFVAEERAFGRRVVIKMLRSGLTEGVSAERFKREISVVSKLHHPHIVPLLTAGDDGQTLYYTMPFVDGENLRDRLAREGALPIADVVRVFREVVSALGLAHRQGIIHRDIKPENVLFSDGSALVTDFGIAKALEIARTNERNVVATITQLGVAVGTPAYMAPEQASGDPTIDHRADLYSLGCVVYEMLAGKPPFESRHAQQLLSMQVAEPPAPITKHRPTTPPQLAAIVMQCLEKRAADRPQSAEEIVRTLEAIAVTATEAVPVAADTRRFDLRLAGLGYATALIAIGIVIGIVISRWFGIG
jgi:serine/threonine protein kinase